MSGLAGCCCGLMSNKISPQTIDGCGYGDFNSNLYQKVVVLAGAAKREQKPPRSGMRRQMAGMLQGAAPYVWQAMRRPDLDGKGARAQGKFLWVLLTGGGSVGPSRQAR